MADLLARQSENDKKAHAIFLYRTPISALAWVSLVPTGLARSHTVRACSEQSDRRAFQNALSILLV